MLSPLTYNNNGTISAPSTPEIASTYDPSKGAFLVNGKAGSSAAGTYVRFMQTSKDYDYLATASAPSMGIMPNVKTEIPYRLDISPTNQSVAVVTILASPLVPGVPMYSNNIYTSAPDAYNAYGISGSVSWQLRIPMVMKIISSSTDTRLYIDSTLNAIAGGGNGYLLAVTASAITNTSSGSVYAGQDSFNLSNLTIKEQVIHAIEDGATFTLSAPAGYHFVMPGTVGTDPVFALAVQPGLGMDNRPYGAIAAGEFGVPVSAIRPAGIDYNVQFGVNDSQLVFSFYPGALIPSTRTPGALVLQNLALTADKNAPAGLASLHISGDVTEQDVPALSHVGTYTIIATSGTGGSVTGGGTYTQGATVTLSAAADSGYTFDGWYENNAKVAGAGAQFSFAATADRTLEARFVSVPQSYAVTFMDGAAVLSTAKTGSGALVARPVDPVRSGSQFTGWYKDSALTQPWDFGRDTVSANMTLYAGWTNGIVITGVVADSGQNQADINFAILSANGKGYTVYLSETGVPGSFAAYANVNYNAQGAHLKGLTNGKTYYVYITYLEGASSGVVSITPGKGK